MNYLIINGSPHKGNTWKLAELTNPFNPTYKQEDR
ncbi:MAG: hypothetical protein K0R15_3021 [Clostridiales bacterium]|jgi:hypothetical protein|nr:hypothetical protein [Clostridiales bacterium]